MSEQLLNGTAHNRLFSAINYRETKGQGYKIIECTAGVGVHVDTTGCICFIVKETLWRPDNDKGVSQNEPCSDWSTHTSPSRSRPITVPHPVAPPTTPSRKSFEGTVLSPRQNQVNVATAVDC